MLPLGDQTREPLIPLMFYRRLLLLGGLLVAGLALPVAQMIRLTAVKGAELRTEAEAKLINRSWQPTVRGQIVDRKGRVLAKDRPAYDIAVDYPVISGQWAFSQAARQARREHREWNQLSSKQRAVLVGEYLPAFERRLDDGWAEFCQLTGMTREALEERKSKILEEVSRQAANVWERQRAEREEELNRGRELSEQVEVATAQVARPIREQVTPHVLLHNVDDQIAFKFPLAGTASARDGVLKLPGVRLIDSTGREYPFDQVQVIIDRANFPGPLASLTPAAITVQGVAVHLVGWMREKVFAEDQARRPVRRVEADGTVTLDRGGYMPGDAVGHWGLESSAEDDLRGLRGLETEQLDTGDKSVAARQPGKDVQLTIDAMLQARVQGLLSTEAGLTVVQPWMKNKAALDGSHLNAGAVIIDVASGDILAMVSTPTFTREQLLENPGSVFKDEVNTPLLNRAISRGYQPGSIVKPLMLCSAVAQGVWEAGREVDCTGHLYPNQPNVLRCWIFKAPFNTTHTARLGKLLDATDAIMASCNIYFFNVGRALGPEGITAAYRQWGVGKSAKHPKLGLGLYYPGEAGPEVETTPADDREITGEDRGDEADAPSTSAPPAARKRAKALALSDATMMGIGQGPVAWTPLHAADAYATLARGGLRIIPRLRADAPVETDDLRLDPRAVQMALRGLQRAVGEENGTGHHITIDTEWGGTGRPEAIFNVSGVKVWGKSGTADSGQKAKDLAGEVLREIDGRAVSIDHSWFVVMVAPKDSDKPKYAIALIVENGGSGGRVAGPLCNQIVWALVAEGYL